jgi:hypothetical protein
VTDEQRKQVFGLKGMLDRRSFVSGRIRIRVVSTVSVIIFSCCLFLPSKLLFRHLVN